MATRDTTQANASPAMDPQNQAESDIRELHALGDLLMLSDTADLDEATVGTIGAMIFERAQRLAVSVRALAELPAQ
jgi:hypothetical protein